MSRMGGFLQLLLETCFHNEIKLLLIVVHDEFWALFIYFVFYGISCFSVTVRALQFVQRG